MNDSLPIYMWIQIKCVLYRLGYIANIYIKKNYIYYFYFDISILYSMLDKKIEYDTVMSLLKNALT